MFSGGQHTVKVDSHLALQKKNCLKSLRFRFGKWLEWKHGEHVRRLGDRLWHQNAQTHSGLDSILYLGWALGKVT